MALLAKTGHSMTVFSITFVKRTNLYAKQLHGIERAPLIINCLCYLIMITQYNVTEWFEENNSM